MLASERRMKRLGIFSPNSDGLDKVGSIKFNKTLSRDVFFMFSSLASYTHPVIDDIITLYVILHI